MRIATTEADVLAAVLGLLAIRRVFHIRLNSGMLRNPAGRPVRFGTVGAPDVWAVLPGAGRALLIEVKRPGGKPTEAQLAALRNVRDAGAAALVVDDAAEFAAILDGLLSNPDADVRPVDGFTAGNARPRAPRLPPDVAAALGPSRGRRAAKSRQGRSQGPS